MRGFLEEFKFYRHAVGQWRYYMKHGTPNEVIEELIRELFSSRKASNFLHMWRCLVFQPFYYAINSNFEEIVRLIEDGGFTIINWVAFFGLPKLLFYFILDGLF